MTRLQRRHFSSTPSGRSRANKFPQWQRLSCAVPEGVAELNEFIMMKLKIIFNFICQVSMCARGGVLFD